MSEQSEQQPRIARLDAVVANRIAAGEVVERPGSVVKELVENSLDAGARRIEIRLLDGGRRRIQVTDDGVGMGSQDAALAFERHATSKIRTASDLIRVGTYGFRGEALASIASVGRVVMYTRRAADELGVHVAAEAGEPLQIKPAACAAGTDLVIEDLFASVPARLAFLRTPATELGHVIRFVDAIALADPQLHLTLRNNERSICDYRPAADLQERATAVLGREVASHLHPIVGEGDYVVMGALSEPGLSRRGPGALVLLVGGRPVRDRTLQHAVAQAYGTLLESGRYPVGVLGIACPVGTVDVNVHPAKSEVRFVSSQAVHGAVGRAVRAMLAATPWLDERLVGAAPAPSARGGGSDQVAEPRPSSPWSPRSSGTSGFRSSWPPQRHDPTEMSTDVSPVDPGPGSNSWSAPPGRITAQQDLPEVVGSGRWQHLRYIGQAGRCFLIFDSDDHLVILDQHAAHERVLFERFVQGFRSGGFPAQRLLIPPVVPLQADEVAALTEHAELLAGLGFEVEPANERAVMIRAAPQVLPPGRAVAEVRAIAGSLVDGGQGQGTEQLLERHAATLACHAAVRSGDVMSAQAVADLLQALAEVDLAGYCPHGRPAVMSAPFDEVGRWFHRS